MGEAIELTMGEELVLVLDSNPTTGYSWEASFDPQLVVLLKQEHRRTSELIGAGGKTIFTFRPVRPGTSAVILTYRRPWEPEAVETRSCELTVR
jgi:inhibitor of cysteine peptidase